MKTNSRIKPIGDEGVLPSVSSCSALQEEEEVFMNISGGNITYGDLHVPFFWRVSNRTELNHHLVDVREGGRAGGGEERGGGGEGKEGGGEEEKETFLCLVLLFFRW